jgi:hypothetical protein
VRPADLTDESVTWTASATTMYASVPLRIGVDLDGVLADMDGELDRQAVVLFGESIARRLLGGAATGAAPHDVKTQEGEMATDAPSETPAPSDTPAPAESVDPEPSSPGLHLTSRQRRRLWHHIATIDNFWETLKEIEPGSIARFAALATDRRWETIFLTKRPASAGATAQVQTQRWLESKGFRLPSVYVVQGSRGQIAAALALDFVIDDTPENCLDVVIDSRARAILVWREDAKQLPSAARRLGIGVVKSVDECLTILAQVDAQSPDKPKMMDRVMRLLGFKEAARA